MLLSFFQHFFHMSFTFSLTKSYSKCRSRLISVLRQGRRHLLPKRFAKAETNTASANLSAACKLENWGKMFARRTVVSRTPSLHPFMGL